METIIWLTGQPGSGKTTIAARLCASGLAVEYFDADEMRTLWPTGYGEEDRRANVERIQAVALYMATSQTIGPMVVACVAPYADQREEFKLRCEKNNIELVEVYLYYDHAVEQRRPSVYLVPDYEVPINPAVMCNTAFMSISDCILTIERAL